MNLGEGDIISRLWEMQAWQVGLIWSAGPLILFVMCWVDVQLHKIRGTSQLTNVTRFLAVMVGDTFLFPTIAALATVMMVKDAPSFMDSNWQTSWVNWLALTLAILVTIIYAFPLNMSQDTRDWTTTRKGRTNIWGAYHFFYFFATAYMLADFGIRGGGLVASQPDAGVISRYAVSWVLFGAFGFLTYLDTIGPAPWYHR